RGWDGVINALWIFAIQNDGVKAHTASAGLPAWAGSVASQHGEFFPVLTAVRRAEYASVFHACVHGVRIGGRGFEMPDTLEFPGMLRAVVPHVGGERFAGFRGRVVDELIALAFGRPWLGVLLPRRRPRLYPSLAAIIRALNDLPEPAAGLRRIDAIRVGGRALEVIHLPARKMRTADVPLLALTIRCKDKFTLARSNQYPYSAHHSLLFMNC